eukprot:1157969-Pelagomonas_calceolata.AAC.9
MPRWKEGQLRHPETITMLQQEAPHSIVLFRPSHKHAQFIKDNALQKQVRLDGGISRHGR